MSIKDSPDELIPAARNSSELQAEQPSPRPRDGSWAPFLGAVLLLLLAVISLVVLQAD